MTLTRLDHAHLDELRRIRYVAFGSEQGEEATERIRDDLDRGFYWGLCDGPALLAAAKLEPTDHWYGGQRVPTQHVGGVVVPPEHRGRGVASQLMRETVVQGAADGAGLSLLYPATTALYRKGGWEHAGLFTDHRLDARHAPVVGEPLRLLAGEHEWEAVRACHEAHGRALSGPAVRPPHRWKSIYDAAFTYVLDAAVGPGIEAYLSYTPKPAGNGWQYTLEVEDWGASTPRGVASLLGFVARHGTMGKDVVMPGPVPHPWSFLVPEQDLRQEDTFAWMARGLDLPAAVAARGYPPGVGLSVTFTVDDPVLPGNRGPWRLEVSDGQGQLAPAPGADVTLAARAVGPLFTGYVGPAQLALAGVARGPADALDLLGAAFAGPTPVMLEFF